MESDFLERQIFSLPLIDWGQLLLVWLAFAVGLLILKWLAVGRFASLAKRTDNKVDDMVAAVLQRTRSLFLVIVALYFAVAATTQDSSAADVIRRIALIATLVQAGLWGNGLIHFWSDWYTSRPGDDEQAQVTAVRAVGLVARVILWAVLLVLALDNFGVDITALVAGLGIGGIAVALAVQNVLQDLLAYISIVVDKPFMYGDFLVVGDFAGSVEHIGIKTTRLRSLSGEQLVFSNSDLLSSRVRNYKRMYERRVSFSSGVTYDTPRDTLEKIPSVIRGIIEELPDIRFDRSHLKSFDDYAITFETVYYVMVPDYAVFMDRQQTINLGIHAAFESVGAEFAFPTQTVHVVSPDEGETETTVR